MTQAVYEFKVTGNESVIKAYDDLEKKQEHSSRVMQQSTEGSRSQISKLSDAFQGISRDVDVLGGQFSATFARGASDAFAMAEAIGGGGLAAAVSGVTLAVAAGAGVWKLWIAEEERAKKAAEDFTKAVKAERELLLKNQKAAFDENKTMSREEFADAQRQATATRAQWEAESKAIKELAAYKSGQTAKDREAIKEELAMRKAAFKELDAELTKQDKLVKDQRAKRVAAQSDSANTQEVDAINARQAAEEAAAKAKTEREIAAFDAASKRISDAGQRDVEQKKRDAEEMAKLQKEVDDAFAKEKERQDKILRDSQAANADADAEEEAQRLKDAKDAADKRHALEERAIEDLKKKAEAQQEATLKERTATASAIGYSATMATLGPVFSVVTSKIQALGEINRETAQDFFKFSDDMPAAALKMAQGIVAGLAAQAAGNVLMEGAKAIGDLAAAATAAATPGGQALVPGYLGSAAAHGAAAAAYGALAGVGAGAALGIGLVRPLTNDEKKKSSDGGGTTSGGPSSGGMASGGGGGGPAVTQVNITYGAGSVTPDDRRRSTQVISEATARAARNPFYQLANRVTQ